LLFIFSPPNFLFSPPVLKFLNGQTKKAGAAIYNGGPGFCLRLSTFYLLGFFNEIAKKRDTHLLMNSPGFLSFFLTYTLWDIA